ncbi:Utp21 specific WD40 associated putative domain-containing protein [Aspergillus coremiiformis]|uniref:Utp21 specific WD40 associated putative domain-containing protein n=1 Tax=Aspergillus coremiiformis TaxID=138285 RepID=A0A5N6YSF9_9EURO|nr:Utp21 specific WD40 associated putative domain-containing protein [Aspergillus coremiiformis]
MSFFTEDEFDMPLPKRQKTVIGQGVRTEPQSAGSKVFAPFRVLSPTTVPFTSIRLGKATYQISTSVGRSVQTYDLQRGLSLVFISRPQTPDTITATVAWQDKVFVAWGHLRRGSPGSIWVYKRGKKVASLEAVKSVTVPIVRLLVFGSWVVGCSGEDIQVWKNASYEHYTSLTPRRTNASPGEPIYTGQVCTMPTYLNKIFAGRYDGGIDIWNVKTGNLIYTMLPSSSTAGAVTVLQATPVLSLIAVAYKSGALSIRNVETDQIALSLRTDSSDAPPVTSISFRTDGLGAGEDGRRSGAMATACIDSGDITMWDLNDGGKVTGTLRGGHRVTEGGTGLGVSHVEFLDGQPVMVSSGKDNALRTWIIDELPFSPIPRSLHSRSGHSAAITTLEFLPSTSDGSEFSGKWLLSSSKDCSLWAFSIRKDSQNTEISQGAVEHKAKKVVGVSGAQELKAPEVTCIACSLNRDGGMSITTSDSIWANPKTTHTDASTKTGWESVLTGHRGDKFARTWFWGKKKAGRWAFETSDKTEVKSVALSQCGTFALVGSAGGSIDIFNMQSGLHRRSFPHHGPKIYITSKRGSFAASNGNSARHNRGVTGLAINGLNQTIVSCGLDGKVKFWDFSSGSLVDELDWYPMTSVTGLRYSSTSELVAFSCDDLSIRVVDMETRKVVREFWGCVGQVNDFSFSPDGRWIIAASMDSIIRVWDLPTGHLIDLFRVPSTCTALAMSSTGEFLATAHADGIGISLWSNRSLFVPISNRNLDETDIADVEVPTLCGETGVAAIEAAFLEDHQPSDAGGPVLSTEQLSRDMVTLSDVPKSKWQTMLHLDLIKERNKPKDPPKAPEKAPFFLPKATEKDSSAGDFDYNHLADSTITERSQVVKTLHSMSAGVGGSRFTILLQSGRDTGDFQPFIEYFKSLSPAKADLEIRSLDPRVCQGHSELSDFVLALSTRLLSKNDFELVNAWMSVFLKIHGDVVLNCSECNENEVLRKALVNWSLVQQREGQRLAELVGYCRGVVGFLRSSR